MVSSYLIGTLLGQAITSLPFNILAMWILARLFKFSNKTLKNAAIAAAAATAMWYLAVIVGIYLMDAFGTSSAQGILIFQIFVVFPIAIASVQKLYGHTSRYLAVGALWAVAAWVINLVSQVFAAIGRFVWN